VKARRELAGRSPRRIFVPRPADASNLNPQAQNAQSILARWTASDWRPVQVTFDDPAPDVAANAAVDLLPLQDGRMWTLRLLTAYQGEFDGIFYPGVHHRADWLALTLRRITGRSVPIVSTLEGLLGVVGSDRREQQLTEIAGHPVYCQKVPRGVLHRMEDLYRRSDHIIAISPFLARMGEALYGPKVTTVPLGVDTALFRPGRRRGSRLKVVGAGGVFPHKRPELFLEMADRFPQADFAWFGEGSLRQPILAEAARRRLSNLRFPGPLPSAGLAGEFATSNVFILPSLSEGVPKVTQEAAAAGLAQIVFGFYEAPTVVDGANGFVVWNDAQLVDKLAEMLDDRTMVTKMGMTGEDMARDWSWDAVAPRWQERIIQGIQS
jgi:glycosyltransferase involved in cell wall biosynthesis